METKNKKKKWPHLVLKKSLNDAWPSEFGGRSKWDTERLINPWRDLPSNGTFKMHVEAQFACSQLHSNLRQIRTTTLLDQVCGANHLLQQLQQQQFV